MVVVRPAHLNGVRVSRQQQKHRRWFDGLTKNDFWVSQQEGFAPEKKPFAVSLSNPVDSNCKPRQAQ
jgi:hypothetical protein